MILSRISGRRNVTANRRLQPRLRPVVETLEGRQLLSSGTANINTSPVVTVGNTTYTLANVAEATTPTNPQYGVNQVWNTNGGSTNWVSWVDITPANMSVKQIAGSGSALFMLGNNGGGNQVWEYTGSGTTWKAVTGTNTTVSAIAGTSSGIYMLGNNGGANQVCEYSGSGTSWTPLYGTSISVSQIASNGASLFMLVNGNGGANSVCEYYVGGIGSFQFNGLEYLTQANSSVSQLVSNGTSVFMLANNGGGNQVWEYTGWSSSTQSYWTPITGTSTTVSEISASGSGLFMLASVGFEPFVWQYTGSGTSWTTQLTNPVAATGYTPAPASAPLYNGYGPSYLDVEQGQTGDCWLLAGLAEVAARDPQDIENMLTYWGTTVDNGSTVGFYSVRFFEPNGTPFYVGVDTSFPINANGLRTYAQVENALGTQALWVALAENAYAQANVMGLLTTSSEGEDSYGDLWGGAPINALQAITGKPATDYSINPTNVAAAWNAGQLIVLNTPGDPPDSAIVPDHSYAVVGYNSASSYEPNIPAFTLFNPWGTQSNNYAPFRNNQVLGLFPASTELVEQNFCTQDIGTRATPKLVPTGPAGVFTVPTAPADVKSEKAALVHGNGRHSSFARHTRPTLVAATGNETLRVKYGITPD